MKIGERASTWIVAHAARVWGLVVIVVVLAASWGALRGIHIHEVRATLRTLDGRWLVVATALTLTNVAIMGLYDVLAFRKTRTRAAERWRFGAVAFCWSNFLTLGPLAGPAIRLWLYRDAVDELSELHAGIVSVVLAFVSGLAGWTMAAFVASRTNASAAVLALAALALVLAMAWIARVVAQRFERFAGEAAGSARTVELALIGWIDWLLAMAVFVACMRATGADAPAVRLVDEFFFGQAIGLASLIPGGFGSSDAYWIATLPLGQNVTTAALAAYRFV